MLSRLSALHLLADSQVESNCESHVYPLTSAKAVVFDHLTLDKSRLLVSIWPASIQNLKWHIPVDPHSLL